MCTALPEDNQLDLLSESAASVVLQPISSCGGIAEVADQWGWERGSHLANVAVMGQGWLCPPAGSAEAHICPCSKMVALQLPRPALVSTPLDDRLS